MSTLAYHITFRLNDDRTLLHDAAERRLFARTLYRIGEPFRLLGFRAADTHGHTIAACDRCEAGQLARQAEYSLHRQLRLDVGFAPARIRPVRDQAHLRNAIRYIFRQEQHHGTECDPYHDASSLPELLGLRVLSQHVPRRVARFLPRLRLDELRAMLPSSSDGATTVTPSLLIESAAAAIGLATIAGHGLDARRARRAIIHMQSSSKPAMLANLLGCSTTTIRRVRALPPEPVLIAAVRGQMQLRAQSPVALARVS